MRRKAFFFLNTAKTKAHKDELRFQFSFWISFVNRSFTFYLILVYLIFKIKMQVIFQMIFFRKFKKWRYSCQKNHFNCIFLKKLFPPDILYSYLRIKVCCVKMYLIIVLMLFIFYNLITCVHTAWFEGHVCYIK